MKSPAAQETRRVQYLKDNPTIVPLKRTSMKSFVSFYALFLAALLAPSAILCRAEVIKDFTLPSATDNSLIQLSDYSGKVVLIHWWRTSCGYCQRGDPRVVALDNAYRDKGLVVIGISDDSTNTAAEIPAYLKRYGITWPVGLNDQGEFVREIKEPHHGGETPGNYVVSRSGELTYLGLDRKPEDSEKLEQTVVRLVAEPVPDKPAIQPRALDSAPDFSLADLTGKKITLKDLGGKSLVVNFFTAGSAGWAGKVLTKLNDEYAGRGLQVIGIDLFDKPEQVQKCIEKFAVKYPVLQGDLATQKAWIGNNKGWATFFVNADGRS
jgi:peroxiredoxin